MYQLVVVGQSAHSQRIKCTGFSLERGTVRVSSSFWAMAGTATARRTSSEIAERSILIGAPFMLHAAQPQQDFSFRDGSPRSGLRIALPTALMKRLKSCRVKLHSGNARALAIEFGFLFESGYKILLSLEYSVFLKVCRGSRKLEPPASSLQIQRPVVHNLSDNF